MAIGNKALGLVGNAERVLMTLALKYELVTGVQVKWRQDQNAIFEMLGEAIKSDNIELVNKANELLELLPKEVRQKFTFRCIEPHHHQPKRVHKYRGVEVESTRTGGKQAIAKVEPKSRVWRGIVEKKG